MARNLAAGVVLSCTVLALLFTLSVSQRPPKSPPPPPPPPSTRPFDFYKLAIQWPESYCNTKTPSTCTTPIKTYFTIHGLWPQYFPDVPVPPYAKDGSCTSATPTNTITLPSLQPILTDMKTYWPNLNGYNSDQENLRFWQHEWKQHGMCSAYPTKPVEYFRQALEIRKKYDMGEILKTVWPHILPSTSEIYTQENISNAIKCGMGVTPQIQTNRDSQRQVQLLEVRLCFDPQMNPMDCPSTHMRYPTPRINPIAVE